MKNSLLYISERWEVMKDEFYEIDPFDDSIDDQTKFNDLFCHEDLLWLKKFNYNIDLGWYGEEEKGYFELYLYKGTDWHYCQLLEKRRTSNYKSILACINQLIINVDSGCYDPIITRWASIDDYNEIEIISLLK